MTAETTDDLFLGGRLRLLQPRRGHRFGGDAALLVAAARSRLEPETGVADLGAGVGAVGLALAALGASRVALVEIDEALCGLCEENARRNGFGDRAETIRADVARLGRKGGPALERCGLVVMNPPFDDAARLRSSPDPDKARAHADGGDVVAEWVGAAARIVAPGGSLVAIHRPEALGALLAALGRSFGDTRLRPVHPRAGAAAARVLIAARAGRRGALALLPPLVMHNETGGFTPEIDAAQRGEAAIGWD